MTTQQPPLCCGAYGSSFFSMLPQTVERLAEPQCFAGRLEHTTWNHKVFEKKIYVSILFSYGGEYHYYRIPFVLLVYEIMLDRNVNTANETINTTGRTYLLDACETGMRSRSRSSLNRLFNSVNLLNLRSAIDCLFFFACESPTSREE